MDAQEQLDARIADLTRGLEIKHAAIPPAVTKALEQASRIAAVSSWFNPIDLWRSVRLSPQPSPDLEWLERLRRRCLVDTRNADQWLMLEYDRLQVLADLNAKGSLGDVARQFAQPGNDTAALLAKMLEGNFTASAPGAKLGIAAEVARWLRAIEANVALPSVDIIKGQLESRALAAELDHMARNVTGRSGEVRGLVSFVRKCWRNAPRELTLLRLQGVGGVGKSTLAAYFARHHLPPEHGDVILVWIDFDKLRIRPDDVRSVLSEFTRQLAWALPECAEQLRQARGALRLHTEHDQTSSRAAVDFVLDALAGWENVLAGRHVLLVLDTFEQVERLPRQSADLLAALDGLRRRMFQRIAILVCGRSVFSAGFGDLQVNDEPVKLQGLSRDASLELLTDRGAMAEKSARRFIAAFDDDLTDAHFRERIGLPILLLLVARLVRDNLFTLQDKDLDEIRRFADAEMATAYVYGRVLSQVPDDLRPLTHPGLVLPEISAEAMSGVIWPVVYPGELPPDAAAADRLFERLAAETWLVETVPGSQPPRVRHRPDLRRAMLTQMANDPNPRAQRQLVALHRRARQWHFGLSKTADLEAEVAYHRLGHVYHSLQVMALTQVRSGPSITQVRGARDGLNWLVEDFPRDFRPVVTMLLGGQLDAATLGALEPRLRVPVLSDLLSCLGRRGEYREAMGLLTQLELDIWPRNPELSREIVRFYLGSGQWRSAVRMARGLVDGPYASALDFGRRFPQLRPFLASYLANGSHKTMALLEQIADIPGLRVQVQSRYLLFAMLFEQLRTPLKQPFGRLLTRLEQVVMSKPPRRGTGEDLQLARLYGTLLRAADPARHNMERFNASARRGAHPVGIATLRQIEAKSYHRRASAQWITACRALERQIEGSGLPSPHLPFIALFEEFHTPFSLALSEAVVEGEALFRLATLAWNLLVDDVRPHDLRPTQFADACIDPHHRRERMHTLVGFLDRSGKLRSFAERLPTLAIADADLKQVAQVYVRWSTAFCGVIEDCSTASEC